MAPSGEADDTDESLRQPIDGLEPRTALRQISSPLRAISSFAPLAAITIFSQGESQLPTVSLSSVSVSSASERRVSEFRRDLSSWLDVAGLEPPFEGAGNLDQQMAHYSVIKRALWDADFGRYGWPESVGGLGGPPLLRAVVGEEIAMRKLADPGCWSMIEVLAPTVLALGSPELAATMVPAFLQGEEMWCQGFSEPGAGSDLASLTCKATAVEGGWRVTGQKVWTSFVQYAQRCVLLTRTGEPGSAHRGITAFFVDVDSPGITYSPIETQHGRLEFAEVFYDDVFIPKTDYSVRSTAAGRWRWTCCPTNGPPPSGTAAPISIEGAATWSPTWPGAKMAPTTPRRRSVRPSRRSSPSA